MERFQKLRELSDDETTATYLVKRKSFDAEFVKLDLVEAEYLELLATIKQDLPSADLYLDNRDGRE